MMSKPNMFFFLKSLPLKMYKPNVRAELVLDPGGHAPSNRQNSDEYLGCISVFDVFQGSLGDCFMLASILSLIKNHEIMSHIMPIDNANEANMNIGAYHFRFWRMGEWFDVVVDDFLPVDPSFSLLFARNVTYFNECWVPLFEKAVAKLTLFNIQLVILQDFLLCFA